jgi:hypothetical protein
MVCSNYTECVKTALGTSQAMHEGMRMITSVAAGQAMHPPMGQLARANRLGVWGLASVPLVRNVIEQMFPFM